jgi:hypothetical protein
MRPGRIKKPMQQNPDLSQVIKSILILPFNVTVTIPFILVTMERPASSGFGSFALDYGNWHNTYRFLPDVHNDNIIF